MTMKCEDIINAFITGHTSGKDDWREIEDNKRARSIIRFRLWHASGEIGNPPIDCRNIRR